MKYTEFQVGEKEYKLRLVAEQVVKAEKKLDGNILNIFMREGNIPSLTELLVVLHGSLQAYHHGIKSTDVYDIYDSYVADGGTYNDLIEKVIEVLEHSGFFKEEQIEEAKEKIEENL